MRGCSSVAKWMQTSTQWSSDEMETLKKMWKKTSKVSAHRESIHHLNSHQWHLITTGSMVSIFKRIFEIRCWMHLSHHTFAHQWSPGNHPIKAWKKHKTRENRWKLSEAVMKCKVGPLWRFKMPLDSRMGGTTHLGIHDNEFVWRSLLLVLGLMLICRDAEKCTLSTSRPQSLLASKSA